MTDLTKINCACGHPMSAHSAPSGEREPYGACKPQCTHPEAKDRITVNGHDYVHVASCHCTCDCREGWAVEDDEPAAMAPDEEGLAEEHRAGLHHNTYMVECHPCRQEEADFDEYRRNRHGNPKCEACEQPAVAGDTYCKGHARLMEYTEHEAKGGIAANN